MTIDGRKIGPDHPVYIIAELSANHLGNLDRAKQIVRAAADAGADALKLQTYSPETMTLDCDRPEFRVGKGTIWEGRTLYDLYGEAMTPWEWHDEIIALSKSLGMACFSTPFDPTSVDFLERLDVPAYKIASFENVDIELIERVASLGKPMIVSTGMATLDEIDEAVAAVKRAGSPPLALLRCTSAYPASPATMNLRSIPHLASRYQCVVGLSDHSPGLAAPVAAVALGARVIEKHLTFRRSDGGPDGKFSLEPQEFAEMVAAVRTAEAALGEPVFGASHAEKPSRVFRRSLFAVRDIDKGEALTRDNVRSIRPGDGLAPKHLPRVLGATAREAIQRGTPLTWDLLHAGEA